MFGEFKVLLTAEQLNQTISSLGKKITEDYKGKDLVLVGVLKGGFMFLADLCRVVDLPCEIDFISVSSYGNSTKSSGIVNLIKDTDISVEDKHVILVEDIVDTGLTLRYLKELFATKGPLSIKLCSLLDKPSKRKVDIKVDYVGIEIPDEFVIGYGLDYAGKYRNLPDLCVFRPSDK